MRGVIERAERVSHRVDYAKTDVREAHACDILTESHALASLGSVFNGSAKRLRDYLDCLEVEHIAHCPCALGDVALDSVGQSVHACCGGQTFGHGGHHVGIDNGDHRNVVNVDADHLAVLFGVGDNIVYRDFCCSSRRGRDGDYRNALVLCRRNALKASDIGELGVLDDYADSFRGVHRGAAADSYDAVCAARLECLNAGLNVLNGRVGLDLAEHLVCDASVVQNICDFLRYAELDEVGVGCDESFLEASCGYLFGNRLDCARAVI